MILPRTHPAYSHPSNKSTGIQGISSWDRCEHPSSLLIPITYLTSRGVPALFNNLTTACTPLTSSNVRSAADESTSTQSKVSRIAEERWATEDVLSGGTPETGLPTDDGMIMDVCREIVKSATKIYNATQHEDKHRSRVVPPKDIADQGMLYWPCDAVRSPVSPTAVGTTGSKSH